MRSLYYNRGNDVIEIKIKDATGKTLDKFRASTSDKMQCSKILRYVKDKYGFDFSPEITPEDVKKMQKEDTEEHNWFDMNNTFFSTG